MADPGDRARLAAEVSADPTSAGIVHAVSGSLSLAAYARPRATLDANLLVGTAVVSHAQTGGPVITNPSEDEEVDPSNLVVTWETVADPSGAGNEITGYEVVVEQEDPRRIFSIHMPATATSVTVPPEFLAAGKESKVEILAISANGNRTATEVPFVVPE